jgi:uncharacterized protein
MILFALQKTMSEPVLPRQSMTLKPACPSAQAGSAISVEVAYGLPAQQWLRAFELPPGARVCDALAAFQAALPALVLPAFEGNIGIFARACTLEDVLSSGDRVELYRALRADPKDSRRARVDAAAKVARQLKAQRQRDQDQL